MFILDFKKHSRVKRATTPEKSMCDLLLVADYRFFQEVGNSELVTAASYLVSWEVIFIYSTHFPNIPQYIDIHDHSI